MVLLDENNIVTDQYMIRAFPTTLIIDRKGVLIAEHIGPLTSELIQNYIGGDSNDNGYSILSRARSRL